MASLGILFLFLSLICISAGNAYSFVNVHCKSQTRGQHGQQSMLDCVVNMAKEAADAEITLVIWKKSGDQKPLVFFHNGELTSVPRFQLAQPSWTKKNMNVSLLINGTTPSDIGEYELQVVTTSGDSSSKARLSVTAKYNEPTVRSNPEKDIPPNTDVTLFCSSDGGFPQGKLRWFDADNHDWTSSSEMEVKQTADNLFQLSSKLTLLKGSVFSKYTCTVLSASGTKEGETKFEVPLTPVKEGQESSLASASRVVAPVVVIGSLIVGLLMALLFFKKRNQRGHPVPQDQDV
ncbi:butyrophilin-like protein 1 [Myripristis murdjan]|uniref:Butyrophilin-like protein 1 n=1 Tax=Myripristis murdjan TaxID=586833 RepID=A0A668AXD6_9TELE|nr:butyrophilin-like protein 1 [Myripristis murdjan]